MCAYMKLVALASRSRANLSMARPLRFALALAFTIYISETYVANLRRDTRAGEIRGDRVAPVTDNASDARSWKDPVA